MLPPIGLSRHTTPVLDFSSLEIPELKALMDAMRRAREEAVDSGLWIELDLIRIMARSIYLHKKAAETAAT